MTFDLQEFIGLTGLHLPEDGACGRRATSFGAGACHPQEVFGFGSLGIPPALEADRIVDRDGEESACAGAVRRLAGTGVPVFLGNGTFSEYLTGIPVDANEWRLRLDLFERLAQDLGRQLYVTAPDKINDQAETLARLQLFAFDMHLVALAGANVLLPMAGGDLAHDEFQGIAQDILGTPVIPSFPMREGITQAQEVINFVQSNMPPKIHLMGVDDVVSTQDLLHSLWDINPEMLISQDITLLKGDDQRRPSDLPVLDAWQEQEDQGEVPIPDSDKARASDAWLGWLVHQAFRLHPAAHQYPGIEALCATELGPEPDLAGQAFSEELKTFQALQVCARVGHA